MIRKGLAYPMISVRVRSERYGADSNGEDSRILGDVKLPYGRRVIRPRI